MNSTLQIPLVTLLIALLLTACTGPQQTAGLDDEDAPIGTRTIIVQTDADDPYAHTARVLQDAGYAIENSDRDIGSITTAMQGVGGTGLAGALGANTVDASISARIDGDRVHVQARHQFTETDGATNTTKSGQSGSPDRTAWAALWSVATDIGIPVDYEE